MQATADCSDDGCSNDGCSSNCSEDSDYTTATQLHKRGEVGEEYDIFSRVLIEGVSREPIRVFDQIEYCPVEGVSGRDYRQAQVLAVRPASDTRLVLSTRRIPPPGRSRDGSCLEDRAQVRVQGRRLADLRSVLHLFGGFFGVHRRRSTGRGLVVGSGPPSTDTAAGKVKGW
ncbi:hypothetical protein THAOC_15784 [Thalassiosira oceanica]|uniref:Uncharacterized protein n=1 Tax=Thalassiosira oceanica TaxID=159749 RepID=K0SDT9_THAOC|nr:hypothetical protein THAOC_15784 [Thalassiosira oceanica]|mmetsp:Transcript_6061/g.13684  ORF Transcript_6061/g.13684 Transcript_6061/m.13684 type:complete len:172 (-) Transcript_6061:1255-1770(-)|eukprot:EJK63550.1 hypothetical protein THAOC_15784 [Thalassiosira oceanica]